MIWDVYAAHRSQKVKDKAKELNIVAFVRAEGTSQFQTLDVRIYGELKSRARKKLEHLAFQKKVEISHKNLAQFWQKLGKVFHQ